MEKKKIIIGTFVALILIGAACEGTVYYYLFAPQFHPKKTVYIYIAVSYTHLDVYKRQFWASSIKSISCSSGCGEVMFCIFSSLIIQIT